jgi:hypothetical protein
VTLQRIEVGLVSADEALVEFFAAVFELERLPAVRSGSGVVHRLEAPGPADQGDGSFAAARLRRTGRALLSVDRRALSDHVRR